MATTITAAAEIERLTDGRNRIRDKLIELGLAVSTDTLDVLAAAIEDIINQGAVQVEILEGTSYTIPAGFHNGSGTVKAMTDTTGEAEKYKVQAKTITPTKNQQSVAPDTGYYALSAVTVNAIPAAYQNVSSVNAAAGDVLVGKIIVTADGKVTTGTMANNGAVTQLLDCTTVTYTIPVGYHDGKGTVSITLEEKTVTPTKAGLTVTPTSGKVLSKVIVAPIPAAYQDITVTTAGKSDVLEGEMFVTSAGDAMYGTMPNNGAVEKSLDTTTTSYTIPNGYHNGEGTVSITTETKTVTPSFSSQIVTPTSGKVLSRVTVKPIPDGYYDITNATAVSDNILAGKTSFGLTNPDSSNPIYGPLVGTMPNNGAVTASINGLTVTEYTIPAGYHNGSGKITLTDDIARALSEI